VASVLAAATMVYWAKRLGVFVGGSLLCLCFSCGYVPIDWLVFMGSYSMKRFYWKSLHQGGSLYHRGPA